MLRKQLRGQPAFLITKFHPVLNERFSESGTMNGHYYHQDILIAQRIFSNNPARHIDIGSRIDGFVAHVASFREIEIFDIRPLKSKTKNIIYRQADLMILPESLIECCDSISSLHALEHFGLGRYGDPIDADGHLKAIKNIHSLLKRGGKFYMSIPIGRQRIEFNAHRVFSLQYILSVLKELFVLDSFSYVDDRGDLFENVSLTSEQISSNLSCDYGCGIFELTKKN